jgi:hypothetical protein
VAGDCEFVISGHISNNKLTPHSEILLISDVDIPPARNAAYHHGIPDTRYAHMYIHLYICLTVAVAVQTSEQLLGLAGRGADG